jgi:hypothetical protein
MAFWPVPMAQSIAGNASSAPEDAPHERHARQQAQHLLHQERDEVRQARQWRT